MEEEVVEDDVCISGRLKLSLCDSISFERLSIPTRSEKCLHIDCFDLPTFIEITESLRDHRSQLANKDIQVNDSQYQCLICDVVFDETQFYIDSFVLSLLKDYPGENVLYIKLDKDLGTKKDCVSESQGNAIEMIITTDNPDIQQGDSYEQEELKSFSPINTINCEDITQNSHHSTVADDNFIEISSSQSDQD
ncbi:MAG: hypothetical protein MHMPM18_002042 [Marteilia pararefringens]